MIKLNKPSFKSCFFHTIFKTEDPEVLSKITTFVVGYLKNPVNIFSPQTPILIGDSDHFFDNRSFILLDHDEFVEVQHLFSQEFLDLSPSERKMFIKKVTDSNKGITRYPLGRELFSICQSSYTPIGFINLPPVFLSMSNSILRSKYLTGAAEKATKQLEADISRLKIKISNKAGGEKRIFSSSKIEKRYHPLITQAISGIMMIYFKHRFPSMISLNLLFAGTPSTDTERIIFQLSVIYKDKNKLKLLKALFIFLNNSLEKRKLSPYLDKNVLKGWAAENPPPFLEKIFSAIANLTDSQLIELLSYLKKEYLDNMTTLRSPFTRALPLIEKEAFRTLIEIHPGISIFVRQSLSYIKLPDKEHQKIQTLLTVEGRAFFDLCNPERSYLEHEFTNSESQIQKTSKFSILKRF